MAADHIPKTIDRYEIIDSLGRGAMGEVYLAREPELDREVAIKVLLSAEGDLKKRFIDEARATARCTHENIVVIHKVDSFEDRPYMVLEYIKGETLDQWMQNSGTDDGVDREQFALETMLSVARALSFAHAQAIIHRDLKPANIMLSENGVPKVLDFGLAKMVPPLTEPIDFGGASSLSQRSTGVCGTIPYMSPEQLSMQTVDHRADIWAFGTILHEMATGRHPQEPLNLEALQRIRRLDVPSPPTQDCDPDLAKLIDACLVKRVESRIGSAADIVLRIEGMLGLPPLSKDRWLASARSLTAPASARPTVFGRVVTTRRAILAASLALPLATWMLRPTTSTEAAKVVVGDFEGALVDDATMAEALGKVLRMGIEASHTVQLLSEKQIQSALERMQQNVRSRIDKNRGLEIGVRENARYLLLPTIQREDDGLFRISVRLYEVSRARITETFDSPPVPQDEIVN
ncbi:MAG: serine/threonine-protein kinase, partial [Myxococcota bacterium]